MNVINVLKDGTRLEDLQGHIVTEKDARAVYTLVDEINKREGRKRNEKNKAKDN